MSDTKETPPFEVGDMVFYPGTKFDRLSFNDCIPPSFQVANVYKGLGHAATYWTVEDLNGVRHFADRLRKVEKSACPPEYAPIAPWKPGDPMEKHPAVVARNAICAIANNQNVEFREWVLAKCCEVCQAGFEMKAPPEQPTPTLDEACPKNWYTQEEWFKWLDKRYMEGTLDLKTIALLLSTHCQAALEKGWQMRAALTAQLESNN